MFRWLRAVQRAVEMASVCKQTEKGQRQKEGVLMGREIGFFKHFM